nr:uncharacterized protein LOC123283342 [Equus asinus]
MAPTLASKGVREGRTLAAARYSQSEKGFSPSAAVPQSPRSIDEEPKDEKKHEGEKNGRRGLRNPQALPTLCLLCGPGAPLHRRFSFSQPPALRGGYLGLDLRIVRGSRTLREKPAERDQKLENEQIRDPVAHRRCYPVSFLFRILYSAHIIYIYITISSRRVHTRCHTLQESINKVQYFQTLGRLQTV